MRWTPIACVVAMLACLTGCTTDDPVLPTPSATSSVPSPDIVTDGEARQIVEELIAYAGTNRVIDVEVTRDEVKMSTIRGQGATTYAWRSGIISQIDSDTAYVGQEIFDPRHVNIDNVDTLFSQAAQFSGSDVNQKLQIVDYGQGTVYMTVTTNPESTPVFFTTSGLMVPHIDSTNLFDLTRALRDVTSAPAVARIGVSSSGAVYADVLAGQGQVSRSLRNQQFPVQTQVRPETVALMEFDPSQVSATKILYAVQQGADSLKRTTDDGFDIAIEQHLEESSPSIYITMGARTVHTTLDGMILPT